MVPRGTLGVPGGLPKASREAPRSRSGRFLRRHQDWRRIWSVPGVSRRTFWEPAGTQKSTKNRLVAKKMASEKVPRSVFHRFSVSSLFWVGFCIDFRWFSGVFCRFFWMFLLAIFVSFFIPNLFRISHFVYDLPKTVMLLKLQLLRYKTLIFKVRRVEDFDHKLQRKYPRTHNEI